ncbi:MAG: hypothetical protein L0332_32330 [Chloroflexi bacterium]|nr:hypothetical protein [Chloroflexota bacterium]MCI0576789.1 hypothetical protein [Chloroflexota bacterium]MCI0650092.1 hypothetical protein [Chloroflexota bacterium]MCI0731391.1 hypothetical protein [Chloroflexota bacterium]
MLEDKEALACPPVPVESQFFNPACILPYGLKVEHIHQAMSDFVDFLGFINQQLHSRELPRLESFLMPANFSSMVGEFIGITIPKYCLDLVKNQYHNRHPDLIPRGIFPNNAVQYTSEGIEVKGSRHAAGWQGHNPESVWLMVFYFDSNSAADEAKGIPPRPFRFRGVYGAKLEKEDWAFSERTATSRRTITASVTRSGAVKMKMNWIYQDLGKGQG